MLPDNSSEIIFRLIKKYNLENLDDNVLEILSKNNRLAGYEIIKIITDVEKGKIDKNSLEIKLGEIFKIENIKELSKDIEKEFFTKKVVKKKISKRKDTYREKIE